MKWWSAAEQSEIDHGSRQREASSESVDKVDTDEWFKEEKRASSGDGNHGRGNLGWCWWMVQSGLHVGDDPLRFGVRARAAKQSTAQQTTLRAQGRCYGNDLDGSIIEPSVQRSPKTLGLMAKCKSPMLWFWVMTSRCDSWHN